MFWNLTAFGAEAPGDGKAVDGTIRNVDALEISKGSRMAHASGAPGEAEKPANSPGSHSTGGSPVIVCGSGKAAASLAAEPDPVLLMRGASLGMFTTTGYCTCKECSGGFDLTYSGTVPQAHHTISADISLFPIGTRLMIGDTVYTVEDIGSNVNGTHIDIYYDNHEDAIAHGKQLQEVFAVQ